eukprot:scaffold56467_cov61-Phaeocystis_antarctica.AAC.1
MRSRLTCSLAHLLTCSLTYLLTHLVPEGVELALVADVDHAPCPRVLLVHLHEVRLVDERLEARRVGRALVEPRLHVLDGRLAIAHEELAGVEREVLVGLLADHDGLVGRGPALERLLHVHDQAVCVGPPGCSDERCSMSSFGTGQLRHYMLPLGSGRGAPPGCVAKET